jgi:hypothetical protein
MHVAANHAVGLVPADRLGDRAVAEVSQVFDRPFSLRL